MKSLISFIFGSIVGAAAGAYVAKSIADGKAEKKIEEATIEARDYYKEKYAPKKEEPKQESVFGKKDDLEANKKITRIYGHQFDLYSEPKEENSNTETHVYELKDEDMVGEDGYSVHYLDYHSDGNLEDDTGNLVDDPVYIVGADVLDDLLDHKKDEVYVRNDATKSDYIITYVDTEYEQEGWDKD